MDHPQYSSYTDWYLKGPLASYVTHSSMAGRTISVIEASQPAGDMSDPPVDELVLIRVLSCNVPFDIDLGAGLFTGMQNYGDFLLVPPNTASDIQIHAPHTVELYSLPVSHCLELLSGEGMQGLDFGKLHAGLFRSDLLNALCQRLVGSIRQPQSVSRLFLEGASMALLGELTLLAGGGGGPRDQQRSNVRDWRVRRAIEILEAHLGEEIGLSQLARAVDLSPARFSVLFRAATGLPPHAWVVRRKIQRACELLLQPKMSITEIAHSLGFCSSQHFSTAFRNQIGVAPNAWRRERLG